MKKNYPYWPIIVFCIIIAFLLPFAFKGFALIAMLVGLGIIKKKNKQAATD